MIVASQWKISSSDRGPALQDVGGSFCKSVRGARARRQSSARERARFRIDRSAKTSVSPRRVVVDAAAPRARPLPARAEPRDARYCVASFRARARLGTSSRASQVASSSTRVGRAIPRRSSRRARASRDDASRARSRRAHAPKSSLMILFDAMSIDGARAARDVELCGARSSDDKGWLAFGLECRHSTARDANAAARRRRRRGRERVRDSTRARRWY